MDNVCRSCNHHRPEKAYQSGAKVIMTAPGDWCAGSFSSFSGRHELIPCDVSRALWAGCKQAAELYEPKVASVPPLESEPSDRTVSNKPSEPIPSSSPKNVSEPLTLIAPTQMSADLFERIGL